jgi:hypothetical protein
MSGTADPDHWMPWLLDRRDAGDPQQRAISPGALAKVRDRVLAGAFRRDGRLRAHPSRVSYRRRARISRSLARSVDIDALLGTSPNPLAPTVGEVLAEALGTAEREEFIAHLAQAIASGDAVRQSAVAYLTAVKPTRSRARTRS